jgi:magnesium chelatase family protein
MRIAAPLTSEPLPILQRIEVASSLSIPSFQLIGLAGPEVAEARERVRAAIEASGFEFPRRRVIVNLSPASIRKRGTGIDLAMALAVLASADGADSESKYPFEVVAWGELGLDGKVKPAGKLMRGICAAWEAGSNLLLVSRDELAEAHSVMTLLEQSGEFGARPPRLIGVENLREAWTRLTAPDLEKEIEHPRLRIGDLKLAAGPETARHLLPLPPLLERLIGVAAAGKHHMILLGPRGSGKSHALEWLIALQPPAPAPLQVQQRLIRELAGIPSSNDPGSSCESPVRRVGIQCRPAALLGGTSIATIRPGEFSLAHGGLLVADELPEWPRDSREALREPLERGCITLTRAEGSLELPARFMLAANGNLCPCGGWPPEFRSPRAGQFSVPLCHCSESERRHYLNRLSGPLLDRVDIGAIIAPENPGEPRPAAQALARLRERCARAREMALRTWEKLPGDLASGDLERLLKANPAWREALDANSSSLRARHKILRLALSLCAWDAPEIDRIARPTSAHFLEAWAHRPERILDAIRPGRATSVD